MKSGLNNLKLIAALAMLAAISIICGKYLALNVGEAMRLSLESMPILFAGLAFGPIAGGLVGAVADLVGCLMVAYTVNPLITIGAALIGIISGLVPVVLKKYALNDKIICAASVVAAHLVGSVLVKTLGLASYYDMPFVMLLLWRTLNYLIVGILDGTVVYMLLHNKGIQMQIKELKKQ